MTIHRRIVSVVLPEGYKDAADFAADCTLEIVTPTDILQENGELCADIERHIQITTDQQQEIERLQEAKRRALAIADERSRDNVALRAALERMMIGGNHIALYRTNLWPHYTTDPQIALERLGAGREYDMWCCWHAIMCARDSLANEQTASEK